jgi:hypothetical protein
MKSRAGDIQSDDRCMSQGKSYNDMCVTKVTKRDNKCLWALITKLRKGKFLKPSVMEKQKGMSNKLA